MKGSLIVGIAFTMLPLLTGQKSAKELSHLQYLDHPWVDSVFLNLSEEERVAQSYWLVSRPEDGLAAMMKSAQAIAEHGLGGLILTKSPSEQALAWIEYCQSVAELPLPVALEGSWSDCYPGKNSLAAIASDPLRYKAGEKLGALLRKNKFSVLMTKNLDEAVARGLGQTQILVIDLERDSLLADGIHRIPATDADLIPGILEASGPSEKVYQRSREALALKYWTMQQDLDQSGSAGEEQLEASGQKAFVRELYAASLTVLKNKEDILPLKDLEKTRIACLAVNQSSMTEFQKMAGRYTRIDHYFWDTDEDNIDELATKLAGYDMVLEAIYPGQESETLQAFLASIANETELVAVYFGEAMDLTETASMANFGADPMVDALILSYEFNALTESLAAQLIFGGIGGSGRLPLKLGDLYPKGGGLSTPGGSRLQYGFPETAGLSSCMLIPAIDSIVHAGLKAEAYPGCQVIVARKGTVVFHQAYGYHTYSRRIKVRKDDLYDLASVTKISGPLSGLMKLEGLGKFSYQGQLGDYSEAMKGSDKASLELKDVLAHRAGLFPWIPYHERILKKNGKYKRRFIRQEEGGRFIVQVYDHLYLSSSFKNKIFRTIRKSELGEPVYRYSGLSFFLFPTIIEELSGQPYEDFLSEQIYHPLGAWELLYHPRSSFPASRIVPTEYDSLFRKELIHGYVHDEGAAVMGSYAGNAGLFASSNDLLKLIEMYRRMGSYGGEQIIPGEVLKEYTTYQFPELEIHRGLGFDKPLLGEKDGTPKDYPCPGASPSSFGHSGFTGTFVWADPEHEITYVFLSNRVHPTRENSLLYDMNIRTSILQSVYDSILKP